MEYFIGESYWRRHGKYTIEEEAYESEITSIITL